MDNPTRPPHTACEFLAQAGSLMNQRGQTYDQPKGERSAAATASAFNAITGHELNETDIWLMLLLLKLVRQENAPAFHRDSAEDTVAYSALYAESLATNGIPQTTNQHSQENTSVNTHP